ncbi:sporulation protein [Streptomyces sp. NPDC052164]|uniref:sporulation protein n=1 Tax=unclassified Streptomyces TaxID=2593676 RepID=UPI003441D0FC
MASTVRRARPPHADLARLIEASGASHKSLALRINQLANADGLDTGYSHTSVANWCRRGMTPKWPVPRFLAQAIAERLGRPVSLADIGMREAETIDADVGLDFPRDPADAVRVATSFWSSVNRRDFLAGSGFAASAFTTPVTRWLITPADETAGHLGGKQVGRADLDELRDAADDARRWDSKYGGGSWKANSVTDCLDHRAAPLLRGSFSDDIGRELFSVSAELSRLAGWTAFDVGRHEAAQRHFIQALRLARAGGDVQLGCYVLTTMALQALMRGFASEAVDMAQGAFNRAKGRAAPRVLAFTRLIEARAHARARDPRSASRALAASEDLLTRAKRDSGDEPAWIDFYAHSRLSADAAEIFRDLKNPKASLAWNGQAAAMPPGTFTRSVGMRLAIVATAHLQARDLDHGIALGNRSVDILARVRSSRALDYVREFTAALDPWRREPVVVEFVRRTHKELGSAARPE